MKRLHTILLTLLLASFPLAAFAQLFIDGERLEYRVAYRAKLFANTEMATVVVATKADTLGGRDVHHVYGEARIMPSYRWFYNIEDRYDVWVDKSTKKTLRFESNLREGDYTFRSYYTYDWNAMSVHTWSQSRQRPPREFDLPLTEQSMDAVSLYFNLRSVDLEEFQSGEVRELQMVLENKVRYLKYRFISREVCRVPNLGKFNTLKFACTIGTTESFSFTDGSEFFIWITNDDNKIPVLLESPIRIGSVRAYIYSYKGLGYPLTSKIGKGV